MPGVLGWLSASQELRRLQEGASLEHSQTEPLTQETVRMQASPRDLIWTPALDRTYTPVLYSYLSRRLFYFAQASVS